MCVYQAGVSVCHLLLKILYNNVVGCYILKESFPLTCTAENCNKHICEKVSHKL